MSASMSALRELLGIDDYERVHDGAYFDVNQAVGKHALILRFHIYWSLLDQSPLTMPLIIM